MALQNETPSACPACNSGFATETLYGWVCSDCGAIPSGDTEE